MSSINISLSADSGMHAASKALIRWAENVEKQSRMTQRTDPQEAKENLAEAKAARDLASRIEQERTTQERIKKELERQTTTVSKLIGQTTQFTTWP